MQASIRLPRRLSRPIIRTVKAQRRFVSHFAGKSSPATALETGARVCVNQAGGTGAERATPILFVPDVLHSSLSFACHMEPYLNSRGFTTGRLDFADSQQFRDGSAEDQVAVKGVVESIRQACEKLGSSAPLLVASGTGAFLAQRYLESWGAAGMLVLNPSSPDCSSTVARWLELQPEQLQSMSGPDFEGAVAASFPPTADDGTESALGAARFARDWLLRGTADPQSLAVAAASYTQPSAQLLREMALRPVNLEPCPVPMLALASEGDVLVTTPDGRQGGPVSGVPPEELGQEHSDLADFFEFHELEPDELFVLAPMADGQPAPGHALEAEYGGHQGWVARLTGQEQAGLVRAAEAAAQVAEIAPDMLGLDVLDQGWEHFDDRPTKLGGDVVPEVDSELMRQAMQWLNSRF